MQSRKPRLDLGFAFASSLLFLGLALVGVLRHEMWRDEWQAWLLASESGSIAQTLHRLVDEGQFPLWPLCLHGLARIFDHPLAMQLVHIGLATASVFVFTRFAPFSRAFKIAFSLGYFTFYEYSIISRNYALALLLALLFCAAYHRRRILLSACMLVGLAASSHQGFLISLPMGLMLLWEGSGRLKGLALPGKRLLVLLILLLLLGSTLAVVLPVEKILDRIPFASGLDAARAVRTCTTIWNGYVPAPSFADDHQWNTNFLRTFNLWEGILDRPGVPALRMTDPVQTREWVAFVFSLAILALACGSLAHDRTVLLVFLASQILMLVFSFVVYFGWLRHHGALYLAFILCLWIARRSQVRPDHAHRALRVLMTGAFVGTVLVLQVVAGAISYAKDLVQPFSANTSAAAFIRREQLDRFPIAGSIDYSVSPVAAVLGRPFFSLDAGAWITAVEWRIAKDYTFAGHAKKTGELLRASPERSVVLVMSFPFHRFVDARNNAADTEGLQLTPIAVFEPGIIPDEKYFIYFVQESGAAVPDRIARLSTGKTRTF